MIHFRPTAFLSSQCSVQVLTTINLRNGGKLMKKSLFMFFMIVLTVFLLIACSRVQKEPVYTKGELRTVKLKKLDGIPREYGSLVGVTANPVYHRWAQLWFQDDNGTVRVVTVGYFEQTMLENVTVITRN
jgi:hypothetical protein